MKTPTILRCITATTILILGSITAAPRTNPGNEPPQPATDPASAELTLYYCPSVSAACQQWAETYASQPEGTGVSLHALPGPGEPAWDKVKQSIALVESDFLDSRKMEGHRALRVGREIFVPVVRSSHPLSGTITETGILPEAITSGKSELEGGILETCILSSREEIDAFLGTPDDRIAFCRLPDALDPRTGELTEELMLIPVDRNGNGRIDPAEDFYQTTEQLQRAVWVGKYPRELYSILYAMLPDRPLEDAELDFLHWIISGGQSQLASLGYSEVQESEMYSLMQKLTGTPTPRLDVPLETEPGRSTSTVPLILLLVLLAVIITLLILKRAGWNSGVGPLPSAAGEGQPDHDLPGGLYYDRSHTWTFLERDGTVRLGLDHFLPELTGPFTRILPADKGSSLRRGEALATLVQSGKKLQIKAPLSGRVITLNPLLKEDPSVLYRDPYNAGWICTMEPRNWSREIKAFFMSGRYGQWLRTEIVRVKDFFAAGIVTGMVPELKVMQEGGELVPGILKDLGPEAWEEFQTQILDKSGPAA